MLTTTLVQFRPICLNPAPDATGIGEQASFSHELSHMGIRQRVPQIPSNRRDDHLARILASLEPVGRGDRHQMSTLSEAAPKFRNGTSTQVSSTDNQR